MTRAAIAPLLALLPILAAAQGWVSVPLPAQPLRVAGRPVQFPFFAGMIYQ